MPTNGPCHQQKQWDGTIASNVAHPDQCIAECRRGTLRRHAKALKKEGSSLTSRGNSGDFSSSLETICASLFGDGGHVGAERERSNNVFASSFFSRSLPWRPRATATQVRSRDSRKGAHLLWDLYCCDAQECGVSNVAGQGLDPNVNWLINTCSQYGATSIRDVGPPPSSYTCALRSPCGSTTTLATSSPTGSMATYVSESRAVHMRSDQQTTTSVTISSASTVQSVSKTADATSSFPDYHEAPSSPPTFDIQNTSGNGAISPGTEVAIVLSAIVVFSLVLTLIVCLLYKRIRRSGRNDAQATGNGSEVDGQAVVEEESRIEQGAGCVFREDSQPQEPHKLLLTAKDGPLVPPARLCERRLLGRKQTPVRPMRARAVSRPASWSRRFLSHVPEEVRTVTEVPDAVAKCDYSCDTEGSTCCSVASNTAATETSSTIKTVATKALKVASPDRSRDPSTRHSLTSWVRSPGPPPDRALPDTPLTRLAVANRSGRRMLSQPPFTQEHGPSRQLATQQRKETDMPGSNSMVVANRAAESIYLAPPSRELCDLTAEYARQAKEQERCSWGSWSGPMACGGVALTTISTSGAPSTRRDKAGDDLSKIRASGEVDLQRLGGSYR